MSTSDRKIASDSASSNTAVIARVVGPVAMLVFPLLVAAIGLGLAVMPASGAAGEHVVRVLQGIVPLTVLLVLVPLLNRVGFYRRFANAILIGVVVTPALILVLIALLPGLGTTVHETPRGWLIGVQLVRLAGSVFLIALASGGVRQPSFTISAGSLDVLIGVTAIPVALLVSGEWTGATAVAAAWNAVGLFDFALAIALARIPGGGPRYLMATSTPTLNALRTPILMIVGFGVPVAIVLHVLSLWQLAGG